MRGGGGGEVGGGGGGGGGGLSLLLSVAGWMGREVLAVTQWTRLWRTNFSDKIFQIFSSIKIFDKYLLASTSTFSHNKEPYDELVVSMILDFYNWKCTGSGSANMKV